MTMEFAASPRNVSEQPSTNAAMHGAVAGCSEALIKCCALALEYRRHVAVREREHADTLIAQAMWSRTEQQVLRWRQFTFVPSWTIRWRWALDVLRRCYPELPGVNDIPDDHWKAALPDIPTACVTEPESSS